MHAVGVLAQHAGGEKSLWDPTILGVLVVLSAVGLFCGSAYLLLATNLGARLGFLIATACLSGFMVLLSSLWITTATPLNSPKGDPPEWHVEEVVDRPENSTIEAVRDITEKGEPIDEENLTPLRPATEAALVRHAAEGGAEPPPQEFAEFAKSTDFLTDFEGFATYTIGGDTKNLFWHTPKYATVQFCETLVVEVAAGERPPVPSCDHLVPPRYAILQFDYGSLRQPPWVYFSLSLLIFGLSLLGLHWYEKDQRERAAGTALRPVVPTSGS
ncbi:MAG: hypothetical protein ACT4OX_14390 [Actinomycetota bacterium]